MEISIPIHQYIQDYSNPPYPSLSPHIVNTRGTTAFVPRIDASSFLPRSCFRGFTQSITIMHQKTWNGRYQWSRFGGENPGGKGGGCFFFGNVVFVGFKFLGGDFCSSRFYPLVFPNIAGWNLPMLNRKYIFNPGPFSSQLCISLPEGIVFLELLWDAFLGMSELLL